MKLTWRILIRIGIPLLLIVPLWCLFFYRAIISEVNDEIDDNLELYAEIIITDFLQGNQVPAGVNGTNNTFKIDSITAPQARDMEGEIFSDEMVYVSQKFETEPARVMKVAFRDASDQYYRLTVMTPSIESEDLLEAIFHWLVLLLCVLILMIVGIVWWVFARNMRPLYRLIGWLNSYQPGTAPAPLDNQTPIREFAYLNECSINFARRSEQLFQEQKQFIGNASHEIQTPIAVCQNRMEMLAETPLSEQQMEQVMKTRQSLEYISRLNRSLLFLTRIDNHQFADEEIVDLRKIAGNLIEDFSEIYSYKNITVDFSADSIPDVKLNPTLATSLITNLIKNAFVHTPSGGKVTVRLEPNILRVSNSSEDDALDAEHIFDRFYQGGRRKGSTGLGLAIVEAIVRMYGFKIEYSYIDGRHQFTVFFQKILP